MSALTATVRMYRLDELGDCFLITLSADGQVSRMLIDCGSFRNSGKSIERLKKVVTHIKDELAGAPLAVLAGTHQHNDHLSGFVHCETLFKSLGAGEVWLSWLDDPNDPDAAKIGDHFHNLRMNVATARDKLTSMPGVDSSTLETLNGVLGFLGSKGVSDPPLVPSKAVDILKKLGKTSYLNPGQTLDMPGLPPGKVRIHVLGPPRKTEQLYRADPKKGESYELALAARSLSSKKFLDAMENETSASSRADDQYPFNEPYKRRGRKLNAGALGKMVKRYAARPESWRKIDTDWTKQAETLALYLDTYTNNSSLVLAIELVESGKVLLFAADAQIGNWSSWADVKWTDAKTSTDDLLGRTIFYKVGHHGSHNSTFAPAFEKMTHGDLCALIPVNKNDPNIKKVNGWKMPAGKLFEKLVERTSNRVLQMDGVNPAACDPSKEPARAAWKNVGVAPKITDMFIELTFSA